MRQTIAHIFAASVVAAAVVIPASAVAPSISGHSHQLPLAGGPKCCS